MTTTSCIRHPEKNRYIQLFDWQVKFCQGNHCAALLLAYFASCHDWKLRNDQYYRRFNDIAEVHGDGRPHIENAYLFFNTEELIDGCMGLYSKKAITEGLGYLALLGVISIHKNPNPRYHFDKTKYFQFYPQVCNRWIADHYPIDGNGSDNTPQAIDYSDRVKRGDATCQNGGLSRENALPASENRRAITDTTNNTTNHTQSINASEQFFDQEQTAVKAIVNALIAKGMAEDKFYPDMLRKIDDLRLAGATVAMFSEGYDLSERVTKQRGFGVSYVIKAVADILAKTKSVRAFEADRTASPSDYGNLFNRVPAWVGNLT